MAVSRPEPGPFTKTSTFSRPCSMPFLAAASAVTWAAKGVDLREALKPAPPADSHAITLPSRSVSETIVLLKLVLMCAWPNGMFFLTRRRPRGRPGFCAAISRSPASLRHLLLAGHLHAPRALARAPVGLRALAVHREATPVAQPTVRA